MNLSFFLFFVMVVLIGFNAASSKKIISPSENPYLLQWADFGHYIKEFNQNDEESIVQYIPNSRAEKFLKDNIPYFHCPDTALEKTYYFRWWTFRKHIKNTPDGFVITEFLPDVPWAGKYNTINCPAGHHFYEGRWLHNQRFLEEYARFWFIGGGDPRKYSFWAPNSILAYASVHRNMSLVTELLPYFVKNYEAWEKSNLCKDGLFWQIDGSDGMEVSVGGSGKRATINSYMVGDARAIADIAMMTGNTELSVKYIDKSATLKYLLLSKLWDNKSEFFKTLPRESSNLVDVRELHGYTPWYFSIPESEHSNAWNFLLSNSGFKTLYGPTTAEQNHPGFKVVYEGHECQWNGPSWPFATSITLKAMANFLRDYNQSVISKFDYVQLLQSYASSHRRINENGKEICWIDENLNPFNGDWISRTMLKSRNQLPNERGKDYNHSAFCDLIISDLVGVRPSMENDLTINPLIPEDCWDWFCLDRIKYHDKILTIIWDKNGTKYHKGKGFSVFINGELMHNTINIEKITLKI